MIKFLFLNLKEILLATKNAKLVHQVPTKDPVIYHELMNVREKLKKNVNIHYI